MELPKINSLRKKEIIINNKKISLKPWTNLQLTNFDSLYNSEKDNIYKQDLILKELILPNIECNQVLTLIEEKMVLIELYKMSKSNIIDVLFKCDKCKADSNYVIDIAKVIKYSEMKIRIIKTTNCVFNIRPFSVYRINLHEDLNTETIKYVASYIDSFEYNDILYEGFTLEDMSNWIVNELDKKDFNELIKKFDEAQPKLDIHAEGICEFCSQKQLLNFKGVEDFLK